MIGFDVLSVKFGILANTSEHTKRNEMLSQYKMELEAKLRAASDAYYNNIPIMSDDEFDQLKDQLYDLDPDNSFLKEVGSPVDSSLLQKVRHVIPMGSLNKCGGNNRQKEFETWVKNSLGGHKDVVVQWKLDGVSIELAYEDGKFIQAITRGDGIIGEDVTHTIKHSAPAQLYNAPKGKLYIRAEAILPISIWDKYFSNEANPRNSVSGLVRRKTELENSSFIALIAYDILSDALHYKTEVDKVKSLDMFGFTTVESDFCHSSKILDVASRKERLRDNLNFEVDGIVIKNNNINEQNNIGSKDGRPKWAIAWKFEARGGFSIIEDVEWNVGTSGRITPVAKVKPVKVSGVVISRVTLHNTDEIERLNLHIGDEVEIIRSGDVIPKLQRVVRSHGGLVPVLNNCPCCGSSVKREGPFYFCFNDKCSGVNFRRLKKWVEKRNIMHLGEQYLRILYDAGIDTISKLYTLDEQGFIKAGIPEGMAVKIFAEVDKSKNVSLADFMGSLSIDMLGRSESQNLIDLGVDSLEKFKNLTSNELLGYTGYQETKANRIINGIKESSGLINKLEPLMNIIKTGNKAVVADTQLVICLTGAMSRPRKEIAAELESCGHKVVDSVGKGVTYLCQADPDSQSSKSKKAVQLGIKVVSEEQLFQLIKK